MTLQEEAAVTARLAATERRQDLKRAYAHRLWITGYQLAAALVFFAIWEFVVASGLVDPLFVSTPQRIASRLGTWLIDGTIVESSTVTIYEAIVGWATASVVGIFFGYLTASWRTLDEVTAPFIDAFNAAPRLALASLFIVWFGLGSASKIALVFSVIVIIAIIATNSAAKSVDPDLVILLRSMGASRRELAQKVVLPWCVPFVFSALRLGMAYSLTAAVVGEMIVSQKGLGNLIAVSAGILDTTGTLAAVIVVVVIAYGASTVLAALENRLLGWRTEILPG